MKVAGNRVHVIGLRNHWKVKGICEGNNLHGSQHNKVIHIVAGQIKGHKK